MRSERREYARLVKRFKTINRCRKATRLEGSPLISPRPCFGDLQLTSPRPKTRARRSPLIGGPSRSRNW
jgi:hypothetical protein